MIVYEREHDYVMVRQTDQSLAAGRIAEQWNEAYFYDSRRFGEVAAAARVLYSGWSKIDVRPSWDGRRQAPQSMANSPLRQRLRAAKRSVHAAEKISPYVALLASLHHTHDPVLESLNVGETNRFLNSERKRQARYKEECGIRDSVSEENLRIHLGMLHFCHYLSLYIAMNEPGSLQENELPWFAERFSRFSAFPFISFQPIRARWLGKQSVGLSHYPLRSDSAVTLKYKAVGKLSIRDFGVGEAYERAPMQEREVSFYPLKAPVLVRFAR
ncbi:hypothetical protein J19TS2_01780 [Cohnella xylanilytica]|uniref:DUF3891 family protein n=1 Tax=Cohnella xylanilytica TaxID=557555 RepID=A0A841TWJ8_9BACL|nr:DUF3891 family protein [Cohnella xylanilytica]MBB6692555.1 DUF3891 family protein [Cohnella xylanilytica]GIO10623.1 hypothetical protein J19TS2_01780 [Cohnella xylanilytica]